MICKCGSNLQERSIQHKYEKAWYKWCRPCERIYVFPSQQAQFDKISRLQEEKALKAEMRKMAVQSRHA